MQTAYAGYSSRVKKSFGRSQYISKLSLGRVSELCVFREEDSIDDRLVAPLHVIEPCMVG